MKEIEAKGKETLQVVLSCWRLVSFPIHGGRCTMAVVVLDGDDDAAVQPPIVCFPELLDVDEKRALWSLYWSWFGWAWAQA